VSRLLHADKVDYQGIVAIILATSVGLVLVVGTAGIVWQGRSLSDAGGEILVGLGGTLVGGLVGFLAGRQQISDVTAPSATRANHSEASPSRGEKSNDQGGEKPPPPLEES
jgi:hypothetical protein